MTRNGGHWSEELARPATTEVLAVRIPYRTLLVPFRGANLWHGILMGHWGIAIAIFRLEPQEVTMNHIICA